MRNYFALLNLPRGADADAALAAMESLTGEEDLALLSDMQAVLYSDVKRAHYDHLHLQYEAIATTLEHMQLAASDDHQWVRRVVEFDPVTLDLDQ